MVPTSRQLQTRAMRWLFLSAGVLAGIAGIQLFLLSEQTDRYFAWTIAPPLSAAFLGAAFWAGALGVGLAARQRFWAQAQLVFAGATTFTLCILLTTLLHLDRFDLQAAEGQSFFFAVVWLIVYLGLPPALLVVLLYQRRARGPVSIPGQPFSPLVRGGVGLMAVVLLALGGAFFLAPQFAASVWPWPLTELSARVVASVVLTLAVPTALVAWNNDTTSFQPVPPVLLVGALLEGIALGRYVHEVNWTRPLAWIYLGVLVGLGIVGALGTLARLSPPAPKVSQPGHIMNDRISHVSEWPPS